MEEEKVELTDEVYKKLINYICNYNEGNENEDNKKFLEDISKNEKYNNNAWWEEKKDGKIYYNQKAHIVMHILSKNNNREEPLEDIQNKGFNYLLYFLIKGQKKEYEGKKWLKTYWKNYADDINKKINKLKEEKNDLLKENIKTLLDYTKLYFSKKSNFSSNNDYSSFNEPILNNLYNWYLNALTNPVEINTYCEYFEEIICNMQQLLIKYFDNTVYKYNLICTLCKTNEVLNELKLKLLEDGDQTKDCLETENELMKTILKAIKLTPTIKI